MVVHRLLQIIRAANFSCHKSIVSIETAVILKARFREDVTFAETKPSIIKERMVEVME